MDNWWVVGYMWANWATVIGLVGIQVSALEKLWTLSYIGTHVCEKKYAV